MGKFALILIAVCLSCFRAHAYEERNLLQQKADKAQLENQLVMNQKWVTYPLYSNREGWSKLLGDTREECIRRGEKRLGYQWQVVKATDYLEFERSGNRTVMENPFDGNCKAIADLLLAELAEGKGRFIDQLINGVFYSCEMTSWALSAHLIAQTSHRSLPDYREELIDLTAGDLGSLLAWTYYFMHPQFDKINPALSHRLRHELQKRILDTYMNTDRFWWIALPWKPGLFVNNWNPWCNSNVLQCFLLLENDPKKLTEAVYRSMMSVDQFINYTHADGACEEGPSYWGHAAGKMYDYLQLLHQATGGKVSLFDCNQIRNMGEYISRSYIGNGWVVNFADASAKGGGDASLIYRYGKAVNSPMMKGYAAYVAKKSKEKGLFAGRDFYRTIEAIACQAELEKVEAQHQVPETTWYPETEFCYMTDQHFFLAAKGGYNDESHNHNDVGTFSLYLDAMPVLIDVGVGTYTRQTFSKERYSIWMMQSDYHNLPVINGVSQKNGARYRASDVQFDPKKKSFSVDIAHAYPETAGVKRWERSYQLSKGGVRIEDNFVLKEVKKPHAIYFMTWKKADLSVKGKVTIEVNGKKIGLTYDKEKLIAAIETIKLVDSRLSSVWGNEIYRVSLLAVDSEMVGRYVYTIDQIK